MATYTLVVGIDARIMRLQPSDNLNIARKVNGQYTTTFDGASNRPVGTQKRLISQNVFSWTDQYAVFLSTPFNVGMQISIASNFEKISFGELCEYDSGRLEAATKANDNLFNGNDKGNSFILNSVHPRLQAAVACKSRDRWIPIYVDNRTHNGVQNTQLTPVNEFAIFWDSRIEVSTMIDFSRITKPFEFSFSPGETTKMVRFGYARANEPSSVDEEPAWYAQ